MTAVGRALDCSINDVLLSCVAGALRSYLVDKGDTVDGVMMRALVPVNLRPVERAGELGNQFGLVFVDVLAEVVAAGDDERRVALAAGAEDAADAGVGDHLLGLAEVLDHLLERQVGLSPGNPRRRRPGPVLDDEL